MKKLLLILFILIGCEKTISPVSSDIGDISFNMKFTTSPIETRSATEITGNSAVLNAIVTTMDEDYIPRVGIFTNIFKYSTSKINIKNSKVFIATPATITGNGFDNPSISISYNAIGLLANTRYYYVPGVCSRNDTVWGNVGMFTTLNDLTISGIITFRNKPVLGINILNTITDKNGYYKKIVSSGMYNIIIDEPGIEYFHETYNISNVSITKNIELTLNYSWIGKSEADTRSSEKWNELLDHNDTLFNMYLSNITVFGKLDVNTAIMILAPSIEHKSDKIIFAKELLAAELNYQNKAYIDGYELVTRLFIIDGEYAYLNSETYPILRFIQYNTRRGGR